MAEDTRQVIEAGHVGLNVSDVNRSKRFYQEVFGFQIMGESHQEGRRFLFLGTRGYVGARVGRASENQRASFLLGGSVWPERL